MAGKKKNRVRYSRTRKGRKKRRGGKSRQGTSKRTAADVPAGQVRLFGHNDTAESLASALQRRGEFDRATQGFHAYPARMHPLAARDVVALFKPSALLDPFCGGGTTLVEAMLAGARAVGRDLNPVAVRVARWRTRLVEPADCENLVDVARSVQKRANRRAHSGKKPRLPDAVWELKRWYQRHLLRELGLLREEIQSLDEPFKTLLDGVHSSLLVKYSDRASDTSNRRKRFKRPKGAVYRAFVHKAEEYARQLADLRKRTPEKSAPADVAQGDARQLDVGSDFDLVLTSPPYPATYDYLPLQQLRLAWLEQEPGELARKELGSRRRFKDKPSVAFDKWKENNQAWIHAAAGALTSGGHLAIAIGDGISRGKRLATAFPTRKAGEDAGLEFVAGATVGRRDPGMDLWKAEHLITFRKP